MTLVAHTDTAFVLRPVLHPGVLYGTTRVPNPSGTPAELPVSRTVDIYEGEYLRPFALSAAQLVARTKSDAAGNWRVEGLNRDRHYSVVAYDHTGGYDPVVKINLIPSPPEA